MANFIIAIDPQAERRQQFLRAAEKSIAPCSGLNVEICQFGPLVAVSARGAGIPFSQCISNKGVAWLFGDALRQNDTWAHAEHLLQWWPHESRAMGTLDGYFAGFAYDSENGLTVGGDILGIFPLYYFQKQDVVLVGASPGLFRLHPCFSPQLSPEGLAGILLSDGLLQNQTLLQGIRRLSISHLLRWKGQGTVQELPRTTLQLSDRFHGLNDTELLDVADQAHERIIRRHLPESPKVLLLSGGLDSRLVAGYLQRTGQTPSVVTFGEPTDHEVIAARAATQLLGWTFHNRETKQRAEFASWQVHWEQLSSGFSSLTGAEIGHLAAGFAPRFWSGFALDFMMSGIIHGKAYDRKLKACTKERFFSAFNHFGRPLTRLGELLAPCGGMSLVNASVDAFENTYWSFPGEQHQKVHLFRMATRFRYHIGGILWRASFGSWPVLPWLDKQFLETCLDMPLQAILNRKMEKNLLITRFPHLASIPLDTNSWRFSPLLSNASLWNHLQDSLPIMRRWRAGWRPWRGNLERRRYHRLYNLDGPEWRIMRRQAEPFRRRLSRWCRADIVDQIVPRPHERCRTTNVFTGNAPCRNLLGLMLWTENQA